MTRREVVDGIVHETVGRYSIRGYEAMQAISTPLHAPKNSHTYSLVGVQQGPPQQFIAAIKKQLPGSEVTSCGDPGLPYASSYRLTVPRFPQTLGASGSTVAGSFAPVQPPRAREATPIVRAATPMVSNVENRRERTPRAATPLLPPHTPEAEYARGRTPLPPPPIKASWARRISQFCLPLLLSFLQPMVAGLGCLTNCVGQAICWAIVTVVVILLVVVGSRWYLCHAYDNGAQGEDVSGAMAAGLCRMFTQAVVESVHSNRQSND